ncbi:hypothetical protein LTR16_001178 [Cryomyces antarcticus]|uniref:Uncharacterized protein n=1 Tax=Cryomyces antarcticus TaxID=329879 RepID=A0ABR0KU50_9PEZI|nr:hypothetical protein LTR16_001178 [Cryomyces antarcticus]
MEMLVIKAMEPFVMEDLPRQHRQDLELFADICSLWCPAVSSMSAMSSKLSLIRQELQRMIRRVLIDQSKPRKRGRPSKGAKIPESTGTASQQLPLAPPPPISTPRLQPQPLPQTSPIQASPSGSTAASASKTTAVKALPTVRDHTTDQLGPEGDEYIPREYDEAGEKKVSATGVPLEGREYRCRTSFVPNRGNKLFMLATECARVLGYRDSYLLFNKNRSLYKIIATQAEKEDLIHQEILPYSYRSRQIAIVTAKSMFRQFGSRLIMNGRRVRDDYWESKAKKQGFTEEDAAGEKRPGAAKQREAAAAEAGSANLLTSLPHGEIIYSNGPALGEGRPQIPPGLHPVTLAPISTMQLPTDDLRSRDYGNVVRPRQEISGAPYQDRTQPSTGAEILSQAAHTAEYNKALGQSRANRSKYLDDFWKRPHEAPPTPTQQQLSAENGHGTALSQSPQQHLHASAPGVGQANVMSHQQPGPTMNPQAFQQQPHPQNPLVQSPIRSAHHQMPPAQAYGGSPAMNIGSGYRPPSSYGYQPQMYPQHQARSPSLNQPQYNMAQYGQYLQQQSAHPHPQQSPLHQPPQLTHQQSTGSMHGAPMGYPSNVRGMSNTGYPEIGRPMYPPQLSASPHPMPPATTGGQPGFHGYTQPGGTPQQGWPGYQ